MIKRITTLATILAALASPAMADLRFQRLDDDQFIVHHRKMTRFGGEGKAMEQLHSEVGSLCIAAGYEYFEVRNQQSQGRRLGWGGGASAMMEVRFHTEEKTEDMIPCRPLSDEGKIKKASKKLRND